MSNKNQGTGNRTEHFSKLELFSMGCTQSHPGKASHLKFPYSIRSVHGTCGLTPDMLQNTGREKIQPKPGNNGEEAHNQNKNKEYTEHRKGLLCQGRPGVTWFLRGQPLRGQFQCLGVS